jgi:hypothetical protein
MLRNLARQGSIVAALLLVTASVAMAAGGGGKPSSSPSWISLSSTGGAATTNVTGSGVTLFEGTTAVTRPFVHLKCYQGGSLVLQAWEAVFSTPTGSASFTFSSPAWQSGAAADCTAYLENWDQYGTKGKVSTLASTNFQVNG